MGRSETIAEEIKKKIEQKKKETKEAIARNTEILIKDTPDAKAKKVIEYDANAINNEVKIVAVDALLEEAVEQINSYTDGIQRRKLLSVIEYTSEEEKRDFIDNANNVYTVKDYAEFILLREQVKLLKEIKERL